jgi:hypothetical protein
MSSSGIYKTPVRTSQETHYVSATESSQLILCKICRIHCGDYEECRLLGCDTVWVLLKIDESEERIASMIRVIRISDTVFRPLCSVLRLLVTAKVVPSSTIPVTLMMEAIHSSETSVLIRAPQPHIPEDAILHSHRRENLKSYIALTGWAV